MEYEIGQANRLGNRSSNQDRFLAVETETSVLLVLADGMGGHQGGELAAELLVNTVRWEFLSHGPAVASPREFLTRSIRKAHETILDMGRRHAPPITPATTAVVCLLQNGEAYWAHVGDSRLYLFREGVAIYRTRDHSYVERLYRRGVISRVEQESHPMRNRVTQCVGCPGEPPQIEVGNTSSLNPGDVLLLCSDGLWGSLDDAQIGALLQRGELDEAIDSLAEQAERVSYPQSDNISILALSLTSVERDEESRKRPRVERPRKDSQPKDLRGAIDQAEEVIKTYESEMHN